MRRLLPLLILPLLLPWGASAETQERSEALAPVQIVVDTVPQVIELSIVEARFDATPDEADALVAKILDYVDGFEQDVAWPRGTVASDLPLGDALRYTQDLAFLSSLVPARVARVERAAAACAAWQDTATAPEVKQWIDETHPSVVEISATLVSLDEATGASPVPIDDTPLRTATARLDAWLNTTAMETVECLEVLAKQLGVDIPNDLRLRVFPHESWPGATVRLIGGVVHAHPGDVTITSAGLGLHEDVQVDKRGAFLFSYRVPLGSSLGAHIVEARFRELVTDTTLTLDRIPVRLLVDPPSRVLTGSRFDVDVEVRSAVPGSLLSGDLWFDGDLVGVHPFRSRLANVNIDAPAVPKTLSGNVSFNGTAWHAPATGTWATAVEAPAPPPPPAPPARARTPGVIIPWLYDQPVWVLVIVVAVLGFVAWEGVVWLRATARRRIGMRRTTVANASAAESVDDAPPVEISGVRSWSLVTMFAAVYAWLVKRGDLGPSATVRDMGAYLRRWDPKIVRDVRAFESIRYGGARYEEKRTKPVMASIAAAWRKILGKE